MKEILLTDGGLGSELRMRGVEVPSHVNSIWSAQVLIDAPQAVEAIHIDYIYAGSDYITINNYGLTQPILRRAGLENRLKEMTISAIDLAKKRRFENKQSECNCLRNNVKRPRSQMRIRGCFENRNGSLGKLDIARQSTECPAKW